MYTRILLQVDQPTLDKYGAMVLHKFIIIKH